MNTLAIQGWNTACSCQPFPTTMNDWRHDYDRGPRGGRTQGAGCLGMLFRHPRILMMLAVLTFGVVGYYTRTQEKPNPFTGETVRVMLTEEQESALGQQAMPQMLRQFGGETADPRKRELVNRVGEKLLVAKEEILKRRGKDAYDYQFRFRVLNDSQTINAFALPGGPVFITEALLNKLTSEDALAGVIGHEIGHVLAWHSNKQMAKDSLYQAAARAAAVATSDGSSGGQAIGQLVGQVLKTKYGRDDEIESDRIGVQLMLVAGYDPEKMIEVMEVLKQASRGGPGAPEWLSTHPDPGNRQERIREFIQFFRDDPYREWK
jgi:predicted Zn-dependent protease